MIKVSGRRAERRFGRWLPTSLVISIAQAGHPQGTGCSYARDRLLRRQLAPLPRGAPGTGKRASTTS